MTCQYGPVQTYYSVVHDPANRLVYLAFTGDFGKIWRVSLDSKTVETYRGFYTAVSYPVGADGIPISQLIDYAKHDGEAEPPRSVWGYIVAGAAATGMLVAILIIVRRGKKRVPQ